MDSWHAMISALNGKDFRALDTEGDGACAIHSVFGVPTSVKSNKLFAETARQTAWCTMGDSAGEFRRRLKVACLYDSVVTCLWTDYLLPVLYEQCQVPTTLEVVMQGRILWSCVATDTALKDALLEHVLCCDLTFQDISFTFTTFPPPCFHPDRILHHQQIM